MTPLATLRIATRALMRNKVRSFLTTLGVLIGVMSVIAMVAVGEGARAQVEATFAAMGTNLLIVMSGSSRGGGAFGGFGSLPSLTWTDLAAIRELTAVRYATPTLRSQVQIVAEEQNWATQLTGVDPEYFDIRNWGMESGSRFTTGDVESGAKVAILGRTVVDQLFGMGADAVGRQVRIKNVPFEVVAVMEKKGQSPMGQDYDDAAFIPQSTFRTRIQGGLGNYVNGVVMVGARDAGSTPVAQRQIEELLRERHAIAPGADDDFSVRNLTEIAAAQQQGTKTMTALLAAVAIVSLLVGGIGIMNIMLVSVTERTREIGVRMAVGAKPRHILSQFLVESVTLSAIGGLAGIALGVLAAERVSTMIGWPLSIRPATILLSFGFAAVIGIVFGAYPAWKASSLDPIEALRWE